MKQFALLFAVLLVAGCSMFHSQPAPTAPVNPANQATIINIGPSHSFSPMTVTVRAGSPVYWKNNDTSTHRIVLDDRRYDSSDITPGSIGCGLILTDAGTHAYHDINNPSMTGTITVTQ